VPKVVILSPHFPPATLAGVHRARHMAKYLPAFGWEPIVVRADEAHYTERLDPDLAKLVPQTVRQVPTSAFPANIARKFGVSDIGLRAYLPFKQALAQLIPAERPDIIFITGSPYYPLLLTSWIKRTFDIPVVLDLQDPWVSAEGALRPKLSKGGLSHLLSTWLEPMAIKHTRFVTSVSDRQNDEMADRYPWLDRQAMAAIPIGGDPEDFDALRSDPPQNPIVKLDSDRINLSYVGTFLPRAGPLVSTLFRALSQFRDKAPDLANRLQLNFVGTSNQPNGGGTHLVSPLAAAGGVIDLVNEVPQRVPFLEALNILANSDGLMMIGSDEPHYTASKIYPGLMSATPFLSMFHAASSAHQILSEAGGGYTLSFNSVDELLGLESSLVLALERFATGQVDVAPPNPAAYEAYTAKHVAGSFAEVFNRVIS
jgi:hypothetical protein